MIYEQILQDITQLTNKPCFYNTGQLTKAEEGVTVSENTIFITLPSIKYIESSEYVIVDKLNINLTLVSLNLEESLKFHKEVYDSLFDKQLPSLKQIIHIRSTQPGMQGSVFTFIINVHIPRIELLRPDHKDYVRRNLKVKINTSQT